MAALLAGSACSTSAVSDASRADTALQRRLDLNGIDLSLPAKGKLILVNVPAFELVAIENGQEAFRSRIIVGKPTTPTPLIDTRVTTVRFRPTWRPTSSMVASGEYKDRIWPPGKNNPLGLAAIRLEPPLLVYLHDTNQRHLFDKDYRAMSHGCIRGRAVGLASRLGVGCPVGQRLGPRARTRYARRASAGYSRLDPILHAISRPGWATSVFSGYLPKTSGQSVRGSRRGLQAVVTSQDLDLCIFQHFRDGS